MLKSYWREAAFEHCVCGLLRLGRAGGRLAARQASGRGTAILQWRVLVALLRRIKTPK